MRDSGRHNGFEGCWRRIDRARDRLSESIESWNSFLSLKPYEFVVDISPDGRGIGSVRMHSEIPPELPLNFGEFFYNLRATLDNAVYAAAVSESGQDPPPDASRLQFPCCYSRKEFSRRGMKQISSLSAMTQSWIAEHQPFVSPDDTHVHFIHVLNDLARKDRHRELRVVGGRIAETRPVISVEHDQTVVFDEVNALHQLVEDGTELVRFTIEGYDGNGVQLNPLTGIDPVLVELGVYPPPWQDAPLGKACRMMTFFVETTIAIIERSATGSTAFEGLTPEDPDERTARTLFSTAEW